MKKLYWGIKLLEISNSDELDIIDSKEFAKRLLKSTQKHQARIDEYTKVLTENKVSWGSLVETNAHEFNEANNPFFC